MKRKITLLSAMTLSLGFAFSQSHQYNFGEATPMGEAKGELINVKKYKASNNKALNVIWEEDFVGATNGTAPVIFSTANGDYTGDGPNFAYWSQTAAANSPTNAPTGMNGNYLRWDSYTPITNESPNFASTSVNGAVRTPVIDLSSALDNEMKLSFLTSSQFCCHPSEFPWEISVSLDGGTTFGTPISLDFGVDRNVNTNSISTPLPITVDLAAELNANPANNNQVVLEFRWVGDIQHTYASGAFQYNTHYYWNLDDLKIYETPAYDLILEEAWTGDIINDYEVSEVPVSLAGNFVAQAKIFNNGRQNPTNTELQVSILDGANVVATATGGILLNNLTTDYDTITFDTGIDLSTLTAATYQVEYEIVFTETDEDLSNNVRNRTLVISDNTYATYNLDMPLRGESPGFDLTASPSTEMKFGNVYIFDQEVTLHGVEMAGHPGYNSYPTALDEQIEIYIYEHDLQAWSFDYVAGPFEYDVTSNRIGASANRPLYNLHQPKPSSADAGEVVLQANTPYVVAFSHFGGDGVHFFYWATPFDHDNSSRIEGPFGSGQTTGWFSYDVETKMALNIDQSLNVSEEELVQSSVRLYPNPATESATISYALKGGSPVSIEVRDLTGKLVYQNDEGEQFKGTHNLEINTSEFSNGMYTYTLITNDVKVTNKFVVNN